MNKLPIDNNANRIESLIARLVVRKVLNAGFYIEVNNGEDVACEFSRDYKTVIAAMGQTDEDNLTLRQRLSFTHGDDENDTFITFFWGNGEDCIHDYGTSLEGVVELREIAEEAFQLAAAALDNMKDSK